MKRVLKELYVLCDLNLRKVADILDNEKLYDAYLDEQVVTNQVLQDYADNQKPPLLEQIKAFLAVRDEYAEYVANHAFSYKPDINDCIRKEAAKIMQDWNTHLTSIHDAVKKSLFNLYRICHYNITPIPHLIFIFEDTNPEAAQDILKEHNIILPSRAFDSLQDALQALRDCIPLFRSHVQGVYGDPPTATSDYALKQIVALEHILKNLHNHTSRQIVELYKTLDYDFELAEKMVCTHIDKADQKTYLDIIEPDKKENQALIQTAKNCARGLLVLGPRLAKQVISCIGEDLETTETRLKEKHFVSKHFQIIFDYVKAIHKGYEELTLFNQKIGRFSNTNLDDIKSIVTAYINKHAKAEIFSLPNTGKWDAKGIDLTPYSLNQIVACGSDFRFAMFLGKEIIGSNFSGSDFTAARLINTRIGNRNNANDFTNFNNCNFRLAELMGAEIFGATFNGANLAGADFTGVTTQKGVYFQNITIDDKTSFEYANLDGAVFSEVKRAGCDTFMTDQEIKNWLNGQNIQGHVRIGGIDGLEHQFAGLTLASPRGEQQNRARDFSRVRSLSQKFDRKQFIEKANTGDDTVLAPNSRKLGARKNTTGRNRTNTGGSTAIFSKIFANDNLAWYNKQNVCLDLTQEKQSLPNENMQTHYIQIYSQQQALQKQIQGLQNPTLATSFTDFCKVPDLKEAVKLQGTFDRQAPTVAAAFKQLVDDYKQLVKMHKEHSEQSKTAVPQNHDTEKKKRAGTWGSLFGRK